MRAPRKPVLITCRACDRDHVQHGAFGWCRGCYSRWRRDGRPAGGPAPHGTPAPVDEIAVAAAVQGLRPTLTPRERRGATTKAMAQRLGCTDRTVTRHLAALKAGA